MKPDSPLRVIAEIANLFSISKYINRHSIDLKVSDVEKQLLALRVHGGRRTQSTNATSGLKLVVKTGKALLVKDQLRVINFCSYRSCLVFCMDLLLARHSGFEIRDISGTLGDILVRTVGRFRHVRCVDSLVQPNNSLYLDISFTK